MGPLQMCGRKDEREQLKWQSEEWHFQAQGAVIREPGTEIFEELEGHDRIDLMKQIMFFSLFNPFVVITCSPLNSSHWIGTLSLR